MLNHNKIKLAVLSALLLPAISFAADPVVTMTETKVISAASPSVDSTKEAPMKPVMNVSSSAKEIADINERLAVLNARFAELEMQSKIATKKSEINKANNPNDIGHDGFAPSVAFIDGVDGSLKAVLYVEGGNTQSVSIGDKVGGWKVKSIKMDSVTVQKGKELKRLGFGSYTNSDNPASSSGTQFGSVPQMSN